MKPGIELCPVTSEELMKSKPIGLRRAQQILSEVRVFVKKEKGAIVLPQDMAKFFDVNVDVILAMLGRLNDDKDKDKDSDKK